MLLFRHFKFSLIKIMVISVITALLCSFKSVQNNENKQVLDNAINLEGYYEATSAVVSGNAIVLDSGK